MRMRRSAGAPGERVSGLENEILSVSRDPQAAVSEDPAPNSSGEAETSRIRRNQPGPTVPPGREPEGPGVGVEDEVDQGHDVRDQQSHEVMDPTDDLGRQSLFERIGAQRRPPKHR